MIPTIKMNYFSDPKKILLRPDLFITDVLPSDFDEWVEVVEQVNPTAVIPPFDPTRQEWTSRAADMAKSRFPDRMVGVVIVGNSDLARRNFFVWAQENDYTPLVFLPHRIWPRKRVIMNLHAERVLEENTWIHFAGGFDDGFEPKSFPGFYTQGADIVAESDGQTGDRAV